MSVEELDKIFPFFVFTYGALLTFVLNNPALVRLADQRLPPLIIKQMNNHRFIALFSLIVGSLWSLQSLWLN